MKKAYINPEMEIVEVKSQALLAGSLNVFSEADAVNSGDVLAPDLGAEEFITFNSDVLDIEL